MIIVFLFFTFLSLISIIGYGAFFNKFILKNNQNLNLGLIGFLGLFLISSISYLTHIFFPHNYFHNLIITILGFTFFIYFFKKKKINVKKENLFIFFLLIIGIFIGKSHDDFPYYHLPNALHFTENKLEFGLGNLNHGFKHHSSIFYLYSTFYLPLIKYYIFNVLNFFFLIFAVFYFYENVDKDLKNNKFDNGSFIKVIFLILLVSIFNRIGEYGTDKTGQLLAAVLICMTIDVALKKNSNLDESKNIFLILSLFIYLITIKTYFIIYLIFPVILVIFFKNKYLIIKEFIFSKLMFFLFSVGILFIILNIAATGCIIYPVSKLCFPNYFYWGLKLETVNYLSNWYEIWSKAGAGPGFRESDPLIYIQGINWTENWINRYFFTKVSDFIFSILFGLLITFLIFKKYFSNKLKLNKNLIIIFSVIIILFLVWFFKFPSLRYGGYILILSIFIITFSLLFNFINCNSKEVKKKFMILLSFSILVFVSKNIIRLNKEFNYSAVDNFKSFPFFFVKKIKYKEQYINGEKVFKVEGMCWATPAPCLRNINRKIKKKYNYRFYYNN